MMMSYDLSHVLEVSIIGILQVRRNNEHSYVRRYRVIDMRLFVINKSLCHIRVIVHHSHIGTFGPVLASSLAVWGILYRTCCLCQTLPRGGLLMVWTKQVYVIAYMVVKIES